MKIFATTLYVNPNRWINTGEIRSKRKLTWLQPINHLNKQERNCFRYASAYLGTGLVIFWPTSDVDSKREQGGGKRGGRKGEQKTETDPPKFGHSFLFTRGTNSAWTSFLHCRERLVI